MNTPILNKQQDHPPAGKPAVLAFHSALGLGADRRNGLFWLDSTTALVAAGGAALLMDVPTGRQTLLDAPDLKVRAVAVHPGRGFLALAGASTIVLVCPTHSLPEVHAHSG